MRREGLQDYIEIIGCRREALVRKFWINSLRPLNTLSIYIPTPLDLSLLSTFEPSLNVHLWTLPCIHLSNFEFSLISTFESSVLSTSELSLVSACIYIQMNACT